MNQSSTNILKKLLADTFSVYLKTLNYHWNVRNTKVFFEVHKLLEKQYEELQEAIDVIAEYIAIQGQYAPGSYSEFQKLTSIVEGDSQKSVNEMVKELEEDNKKIISFINEKQDQVDFLTNDLLVNRAVAHSKAAWMLKATVERINN